MKKNLLIAVVLGLAVNIASAAKLDGAPAPACEGLKVATGPAGKGYSKWYGDIGRAAGTTGTCEVNSDGGLDNLSILSAKKSDLAVVPLDALKFMAQGDENVANLQVVATLHNNYLHILTRAGGYSFEGEKKYGFLKGDNKTVRITKLSDLRGQRVALVGSAQLMVQQLNKTLNLNMDMHDVEKDEDAFTMAQKGQVVAVFTVAAWPHGKITGLKQDSGLTLVPFDMNISGPYVVRPLSYKNIGVYNVQSLGVQNLLVARSFAGKKTAEVAAFKNVIAKQLPELKDGDYEPAWNEIKTLDGTVDWPNKFNAKK